MKCSLAALVLLSLACTSTVDDTGASSADLPSCDITVDDTWPVQGAPDFYFRDSIEFTLSEADPDAQFIFSRSGEMTTEDDGRRLIFTPDEPLPPSTDFEISLDYCHGSPTIDFQTSELGKDLDNPLDILGKTFQIDLLHARYQENPGVADLLMGWLGRDLLFQITDIDDGTMSIRLAIAAEDAEAGQDHCYRNFDIEGLELDGSDLVFTVDELLFSFYGGSLQIGDFDLLATMAPDLSWLGGGSFWGWVNLTDFASALDLGDNEEICDIIENLGASCEPCPDDDSKSCVTLSGDRITAVAVDVDLESIEERDSYPDCPNYEED